MTSRDGDGPDGAPRAIEADHVVELGSVNTVVAANSTQAQDKTADPAVTIVVAPVDRRGSYSATLDGCVVIESSRQPFCDAARRLLDLGYDPNITLEMWRPGAGSWDMRGPLQVAARLDVKDARFVKHQPRPEGGGKADASLVDAADGPGPNPALRPRSTRSGLAASVRPASARGSLLNPEKKRDRR